MEKSGKIDHQLIFLSSIGGGGGGEGLAHSVLTHVSHTSKHDSLGTTSLNREKHYRE